MRSNEPLNPSVQVRDPFIFYRPGELTLLIEPQRPDAIKGRRTLEPRALRGFAALLESLGIPLRRDGGDQRWRRPLVLTRGAADGSARERIRVLHTVRLASWLSDDERDALSAVEEHRRTRAAVVAVADALHRLDRLEKPDALAADGFVLRAWSPNWLAAPGGACMFGSPGAPPRPLANVTAPPSFRKDAAGGDPVAALVKKANGRAAPAGNLHGEGVVIAVLDTWPVTALARFAGPHTPFHNALLEAAAGGSLVKAVKDYVQPLRRSSLHSRRRGWHRFIEAAYDESDHGLFVAGILRDIAPGAEIVVYRVLNDGGIGDLMTVAAAVEDALADPRARGKRLVLNLSLGIGVHALLAQELLADPGRYYDDPDALQAAIEKLGPGGSERTDDEEFKALLTLGVVESAGSSFRFAGVYAAVEFLFAFQQPPAGAPAPLVIAAAGNNSGGAGRRFGPRIPAALEGVLAVAAFVPEVGGPWRMAEYSNDDDLFPDNDGVGAFGGDVDLGRGVTRAGAGVKGLYASLETPPPLPGWPGPAGAPNTTGWALWAGTSFATPVVAGVAACLWSASPARSPHEVRDQIITAPDSYLDLRQYP